jgi:P4 family phage/plasmid primase-like protien
METSLPTHSSSDSKNETHNGGSAPQLWNPLGPYIPTPILTHEDLLAKYSNNIQFPWSSTTPTPKPVTTSTPLAPRFRVINTPNRQIDTQQTNLPLMPQNLPLFIPGLSSNGNGVKQLNLPASPVPLTHGEEIRLMQQGHPLVRLNGNTYKYEQTLPIEIPFSQNSLEINSNLYPQTLPIKPTPEKKKPASRFTALNKVLEPSSQYTKHYDLLPAYIKFATLTPTDFNIGRMIGDFISNIAKYIPNTKNVYIWIEKDKIWRLDCERSLIYVIMTIAMPKIWDCIEFFRKQKEYKKEDEDDDEHPIKNLKKLRIILQGETPIRKAMCVILSIIRDDTFHLKLHSDRDSLPIKGGKLVSLITGEVRKRTSADFFTFELDRQYTRSPEPHDEIQRFWHNITLGDMDYLNFLLSSLAYCLSGRVDWQILWFLYGRLAANGKTTIMNFMKKILGDYHVTLKTEVFFKKKGSRPSDGNSSSHMIEQLRYKRLADINEPGETDELDQATLKLLTGGNSFTSRGNYVGFSEVIPYFKIFVCLNEMVYMPQGGDAGVWRRAVMCPFECKFTKDPKESHERLLDESFNDRMIADDRAMDFFFSTLITFGMYNYERRSKPDYPLKVRECIAEVKEEVNPFARFLRDCTETIEGSETSSSALFEEFNKWRTRNSILKTYESNKFSREMTKIVGSSQRSSKGYACYKNMSLKSLGLVQGGGQDPFKDMKH